MRTLFGPFTQIITMSNLPLNGPISEKDLEIICDGGIIVEKELIIEIGKFSLLANQCDEVFEITSPHVLLPGFIDCHTHVCFAGSRANEYSKKKEGISYQQILSEGGGIYDTMEKTALSSYDELKKLTENRLNRHFSEGVLTCEVKSGYGKDFENEIRMLQIINDIDTSNPYDLVSTCLAAHVPPKNADISSEKYLSSIINDLLPLIKKDKLSNRVDIFIEKDAFNVKEAKAFLKLANEKGFDTLVHGNQFTNGGLNVAVDSNSISVDHLEVINETEIKYLSKSKTSAVVLPGCSIGIGLPFAPARKILDHGCCLAIATDWNPGSAPMGDLLTQASIIAASEKLTNAEVFSAISFRAANVLGLKDRGVIEKNKIADFIGFNISDYKEILYNQGKIKPSFICKRGKVYNN